MARFQPRLNIWKLSPEQRAALQPGQHITAGEGPDAPRGVYLGQRAGSDVAAWEGNAARHAKGRAAYIATLRDYATA
ncbi:hypothetical protein RPALISO_244 [Ruegeria phage RpAliso]|nr:hypothetical protein RPALISO_244 [Ruegeria phage RpAliso]